MFFMNHLVSHAHCKKLYSSPAPIPWETGSLNHVWFMSIMVAPSCFSTDRFTWGNVTCLWPIKIRGSLLSSSWNVFNITLEKRYKKQMNVFYIRKLFSMMPGSEHSFWAMLGSLRGQTKPGRKAEQKDRKNLGPCLCDQPAPLLPQSLLASTSSWFQSLNLNLSSNPNGIFPVLTWIFLHRFWRKVLPQPSVFPGLG